MGHGVSKMTRNPPLWIVIQIATIMWSVCMSTIVKDKSVNIEYQPYAITRPYKCIVISLQP